MPGVHAIPTKFETPDEFIKEHLNRAQFEVESELLEISQAAGCSPEFAVEAPMTIRLRKHPTLASWIAKSSFESQKEMARDVLAQIRGLHKAGVCHRDIKVDDIVLDGDRPLLIDLELGTKVDPNGQCYDLLGPASGVSLPLAHGVAGLVVGVWWDSPALGLVRTWPGLPSWKVLETSA